VHTALCCFHNIVLFPLYSTFEVRNAWILMAVACFHFSEAKAFNGHKSKENLSVIHHSHILKLAFLSEITIFTAEACQGVRSDCAVSLWKPQIWQTNVRWPALICSLDSASFFQIFSPYFTSHFFTIFRLFHSYFSGKMLF